MQNNNTAIILDDLQIAQVEALANYLPIEQVAGYFNLSVSNFLDLQKKDKRVLRAYRKGKVRGMCKVAELLWQQMEAGNVSAIIFFLKTQGGWSERPVAETENNVPELKNIKLIYKEFEAEKARELKLANLKQFSEQEKTIEQDVVLPITHQCADEYKNTIDSLEHSNGKTLVVIAQKARVSNRTVTQYDSIQRKCTDEQKAEVASGNSSIKKAEYLGINNSTEHLNLDNSLDNYNVICYNPFKEIYSSYDQNFQP